MPLDARIRELLAFYRGRAAAAGVKRCRGCGRQRATRPRGLCWSCYYRPGVREQYPSESKYAGRGVGNGHRGYRLPDAPTAAPPGSPGKVAVLEERARLGRALWHPHDAA